MKPVTLCVTKDAERPRLHPHAERGNDLEAKAWLQKALAPPNR